MACIERTPRCGEVDLIEEPIDVAISIISILITIGGIIAASVEYEAVGGFLQSVAGFLGGAGAASAVAAAIVAIALIVLIGSYAIDRCTSDGGDSQCLAGVVNNVVEDFSGDAWEELFPFTAMHDRIDLVVKSKYWDKVENNAVKVFCTDEPPSTFRRSEILRCYYFTERVCNAATGSIYGGTAGAVVGIIGAALAGAAIGCATIILCLFALLLAVIIAAVAVLVGALIGGQIAKATSDDTSPSDSSGTSIVVGDLLTVNGPLSTRDYDEGANVMYFVITSSLSGKASDGTPSNPFSYCEIDEEFSMDGCPVIIL